MRRLSFTWLVVRVSLATTVVAVAGAILPLVAFAAHGDPGGI